MLWHNQSIKYQNQTQRPERVRGKRKRPNLAPARPAVKRVRRIPYARIAVFIMVVSSTQDGVKNGKSKNFKEKP
jgi:hypothetical protein